MERMFRLQGWISLCSPCKFFFVAFFFAICWVVLPHDMVTAQVQITQIH